MEKRRGRKVVADNRRIWIERREWRWNKEKGSWMEGEGEEDKEGGKDQQEKEVVRGEHMKEEDKERKWRKSGIWRKGEERKIEEEWKRSRMKWGNDGRGEGEGGI
ncbi:hypothetical protein RF55_13516 [Lasius niger]|uniref:Uncharacterized protein n=1 Tax=Lasius niger TaxID=67767 RepID=A0A0J7N3G2_LASNI|nr:hypothetical protein RF55_13516 [Lasius niger]